MPGRRHGDPESSSELVNRPLSSLTTSNVPRPLYPPTDRPPVVLCAPHRDSRSIPPLYYTVLCHIPTLQHVRFYHRRFHRRLFCSQPTAIEFFLHKTNPAQSLCAYTPTHIYTHRSTIVYAHRLGRYSREYSARVHVRPPNHLVFIIAVVYTPVDVFLS